MASNKNNLTFGIDQILCADNSKNCGKDHFTHNGDYHQPKRDQDVSLLHSEDVTEEGKTTFKTFLLGQAPLCGATEALFF